MQSGYVELKNGERLSVVNSTIAAEEKHLAEGVSVRTASGGRCGITVLRDTGCYTVVVRRNLVPEKDLTGTSKRVNLIDRTVKVLPEAKL